MTSERFTLYVEQLLRRNSPMTKDEIRSGLRTYEVQAGKSKYKRRILPNSRELGHILKQSQFARIGDKFTLRRTYESTDNTT